MQELLNRLSSKVFSDAFFSHLNSGSLPKKTSVRQGELVFEAWANTGKHLRKALDRHGKASSAQTPRR